MADKGTHGDSRRNVSRRRLLKAGAAASAVGLAGCAGNRGGDGGGGGTTTASDGGGETTTTKSGDGGDGGGGDTIRMVQFAPLSGPYSIFGKWVQRGGELAAKQINEEGGINGKELKLEFADSETDPNATVQKAKQYNNNGVDYFLHGVSSAVGAALQGWAANNGAFVTIDGDGATTITGSDCVSNAVRVNRNVSMGAYSLGVYAQDQFPDVSDYWFIGADYNWGHTGVEYCKQIAKANGNNVVGESFAPLGTKDFSTYINKIQNSSAKGLFVVVSGSDFIRFVNQATEYGLRDKLDIMLCTNAGDVDTSKELGSMATGIASTTRWYFNADYGTDGQSQFNQAWMDEYDSLPRGVGENAWAGLWMNKLVMEEAGSTKVDDVVDTYPGFSWDSGRATIPRTIRECDHQAKQKIFVGQLTETDEYDFPILEGETYDPAERKLIRDCSETGCNLG
ncbi:MAG: ABC transporter substrate-binding protein [Haloarculaceae archaeon]